MKQNKIEIPCHSGTRKIHPCWKAKGVNIRHTMYILQPFTRSNGVFKWANILEWDINLHIFFLNQWLVKSQNYQLGKWHIRLSQTCVQYNRYVLCLSRNWHTCLQSHIRKRTETIKKRLYCSQTVSSLLLVSSLLEDNRAFNRSPHNSSFQ